MSSHLPLVHSLSVKRLIEEREKEEEIRSEGDGLLLLYNEFIVCTTSDCCQLPPPSPTNNYNCQAFAVSTVLLSWDITGYRFLKHSTQ